ncbi:hypothetical protein [Actinomadura craniellae]|uniref:hypothetical protein n=1 Tax=Actinomadura craniellae TaxID=2231787 RepID=UPI0018F1E6EB|nr:hypothetical protein [Actinomadura craniellae]
MAAGGATFDEAVADLVHLLITRVRLTERQVSEMSRHEAVARLQRFWLDGS